MSHFMMIIRFELGQRILVATFDVGKDSDGNIIQRSPIYLGLDDRFRDFKDVQVFTENWKHGCEFEQHIQNLDQTVEQICGLIKILHKINGLKAFL